MSNHPTEPSADLREAANFIWQMFIALTNEGFNERQALMILGQMMAANKPDGEQS